MPGNRLSFRNVLLTPPLPVAAPRILFQIQKQTTPVWCWAAVAASVAAHYDTNSQFTECGLASKLVTNSTVDCCNFVFKPPTKCVKRREIDVVLKHTGNIDTDDVLPGAQFTFKMVQDAISDSLPLEERRLICVSKEVDGGILEHAIVIYDWSVDLQTGRNMLAIADPEDGKNGPMDFDNNVGEFRLVCFTKR